MYYRMDPYRKFNEFSFNPFFRPLMEMMDGVNAFPGHVREKEDRYELEAVLPGIEPENINVSVRDDTLTISVDPPKKDEASAEKGGTECRGHCRGPRLQRSYELEGIDKDNITAAYRNGIVYVTLPKEQKKQAETRRIALTVDAPQAMTVTAE